ncbi:hypothetical protein KFK09_026179 [Dendrobium nobile]|uniref:Uncharacterized protein n=1 Tax=Dendrobium nobile TaxID=94219 RepID=A0A8T3A604_DENNO|nr:hypothetical protein KFK09_026179 [Dendrobium nobile]
MGIYNNREKEKENCVFESSNNITINSNISSYLLPKLKIFINNKFSFIFRPVFVSWLEMIEVIYKLA